jgi:hypothetical protein
VGLRASARDSCGAPRPRTAGSSTTTGARS